MTLHAHEPVPAAGFADPVLGAQQSFRAILNAMARPGTIEALASAPDPPPPLARSAAAACLTLLDHDTPLWLGDDLRTPAAIGYLRFHCGCPMASAPEEARFALSAEEAAPMSALPAGTPDYPDRSATLIQQVRALHCKGAMTFAGPGIDDSLSVGVEGLPESFWAERERFCAAFPCGIDILFAAGSFVMALPRGIRVER